MLAMRTSTQRAVAPATASIRRQPCVTLRRARCLGAVGPSSQGINAASTSAASSSGRDHVKASAVAGTAPNPVSAAAAADFAAMSYNEQYTALFGNGPLELLELDTRKPVAKPVKDAQRDVEGAIKVLNSDFWAVARRPLWGGRKWSLTDMGYGAFILGMHLVACLAPMTYSPAMVGLFFAMYFVSGCLGITLSYHRQLSHRAFQTPKWLEYTLAYCGVLAAQGDPLEWVSGHRYHHLHTDTPLDPHSPFEGLWWSHAGWLLDNDVTIKRVGDRTNASDMESQWFYRWLGQTWPWHVVGQFALLFALGGLPALVWGGALRVCWVYHITWFVNSASHVWGNQTYNTGDLSRNNWWVGILAFGEGWHNNHHAFEFSARHGLEPHQIDMTYMIVQALQAVGLATNVKLPTEKQKERLRFKTAPTPA
ncbi:hypothetical protein FOA52_005744 [Chlamydomonas sp. UWO 241]|nr:hypothetical protein FOA52_005744 [Chlamydomonas sp. UWO 241]